MTATQCLNEMNISRNVALFLKKNKEERLFMYEALLIWQKVTVFYSLHLFAFLLMILYL